MSIALPRHLKSRFPAYARGSYQLADCSERTCHLIGEEKTASRPLNTTAGSITRDLAQRVIRTMILNKLTSAYRYNRGLLVVFAVCVGVVLWYCTWKYQQNAKRTAKHEPAKPGEYSPNSSYRSEE